MNDNARDPDELVIRIAGWRATGASSEDMVDNLIRDGMLPRDAEDVVFRALLGFEIALLRSIGYPFRNGRRSESIVVHAFQFARNRIGTKDAPPFLHRWPFVLKGLSFVLGLLLAVLATFLFAFVAPEKLLHAVGYVAAAIALLSTPFIFYQLWKNGID